MEERARRIAQNEVMFRTVNEKMVGLNEAFSAVTDRVDIVCECGDIACTEQISLTHDDYNQLRSDDRQFATIEGHVAVGAEDVIEHHDDYEVVRKRPGLQTEIVEERA